MSGWVNSVDDAIVCVAQDGSLFSIRREGYLFWTGIDSNRWVKEPSKERESLIFETTDRSLVYAYANVLNGENKSTLVVWDTESGVG